MTARRGRLLACLVCLFTALLVWNGIFGVLVSRGEKQYLLDQARAELGLGPPASLSHRMDETVRDAVRQATRWSLVVFLLGVAAVVLASRPRDEPRADGSAPLAD